MSDNQPIPNGDESVSRRECAIVHSSLAAEMHRALRQMKWFIGISTSTIVTMCVLAIAQVQQTVPKEVPPKWFVARVERLESTVTLRLEKIEIRVDRIEAAIQRLDLRVDRLERTIQRRLDDSVKAATGATNDD